MVKKQSETPKQQGKDKPKKKKKKIKKHPPKALK